MRAVRSVFLGMVLGMASAVALAAEDSALICDNLAGSPDDLDLPADVTGIAFEALDPTDAVEQACIEAMTTYPRQRRFPAHLGRVYSKRGHFTAALEAYRLASAKGSAIATNNLGAMYVRGQGVAKNERRATGYFRRAAHRGLPHAMKTMAGRARLGRGMTASLDMAFFWYEMAHEAGNLEATSDLGVMYSEGYGVREDDTRAVSLFAQAIQNDPSNAQAAVNLAAAYETGEGVPVDYGWARGYYALAFDSGNADSADDLGRFHAEGLGSAPDPVAAFGWYQRGADAGSLYATVSLAEAYENGAGTEPDLDMSRSLYLSALDLNPDEEWQKYIEDRLDALTGLNATDDSATLE